MNSWVRCAGAIGTTVATLSVSGCATGPDPEVVRAQTAVQGARAEPAVAEYAPLALREAEQALLKVEQGQWQGLDDEEIDLLAYLAVKKAAIAQARSIIVEEILAGRADDLYYLWRLAQGLHLDPATVQRLHQTLGLDA